VEDSTLIHEVLAHFGDYVREETLTVDLVQMHLEEGSTIPPHLPKASLDMGGHEVTVAVSKK
jgi:hypothetical protein